MSASYTDIEDFRIRNERRKELYDRLKRDHYEKLLSFNT